jgi:nucleoid-associated protein YgaU
MSLRSDAEMDNNTHTIIDYQNAVLISLKEQFPSFLLGLGLFIFVTFFTVRAIGVKINTTKIKEAKSITIDSVKTYTVKNGDDLWKIAEQMYGSGFNAVDIAQANKLSEPYTLVENQILIIPSIASKKPTQGEITEKAVQTTRVTEYTVLPGEYLWQIAEKVYGDGNQMSKLIEKNNIPYPYNVEEGQKLLVP